MCKQSFILWFLRKLTIGSTTGSADRLVGSHLDLMDTRQATHEVTIEIDRKRKELNAMLSYGNIFIHASDESILQAGKDYDVSRSIPQTCTGTIESHSDESDEISLFRKPV